MRIAVDAMGSDNFPAADVGGAVLAAREWADEIIIVGDESVIERELAKHSTAGLNLRVVHASQTVSQTDQPTDAAKNKPDSSIHIGSQLVKDGAADAFVSAGNTGALLAILMLYTLKRIRGVKRPAIAPVVPLPTGNLVVVDMGANADCKPEFLYQFAVMGAVLAEKVLGIQNPRVALLNIGEEQGKGNELVRQSAQLLAASSLNYIGSAEPKEILTGHADVAISDGFTIDIFIKTLEATVKLLTNEIRREIRSSPLTTLGGMLARPAFRRVGYRLNPQTVGGAVLLGVNGVAIKAHGRSDAIAIKNAIGQARLAVQNGMLQAIQDGLQL